MIITGITWVANSHGMSLCLVHIIRNFRLTLDEDQEKVGDRDSFFKHNRKQRLVGQMLTFDFSN
jgi:hypothetical protein